MGSTLTYRLNELDSSSVAEAGGKGSSLGELMRAGAPVPPGFVITSAAFKAFMEAADHERRVDRIVRRLDAGEIAVAQAVAGIASQLADARVPPDVADAILAAAQRLDVPRVSVRSSATCEDGGATAWAGQLDTYLDVSPEDVLERVRDCWLSIFSEPALAYGAAHGYGGGQFAVAVVVQKMVSSEVSGIGFSVHPVTQEPNLLLIEACLGLGEAIVSGRIVPDQYVVERGSNNIAERFVGDQKEGLFMEPGDSGATWRALGDSGRASKLTDEQVTEYSKLLAKIQDHYGHPVDTEWALENGRFQVLQARPITTLAKEYQQQVIDPDDKWETFIHRPMSLVEVSISSHWLDSDHADADLGFFSDRAMSIQDDTDLAHLFVFPPEFEAALDRIADLYRNNRGKLNQILERGHTIYRDCQSRIDAGTKAFESLDEAGDFFAEVAQHTTVVPAWVLLTYEREGFDDPDIRALAERLRSRTLYPVIERQIIDPIAASAAAALGFSAPEKAPQVVTWNELRRGALNRDELESRLEAVQAGHRFVFQSIDGQDQVRFVSQSGYLLMRLAKQRQIVPQGSRNELVGQAAWPGVHRGRARVILSPDAVGLSIEEGEVLVSIQSSPALMPLLVRCGAIVTDDGGIACHAAIIARELRKPTLIGTGSATSTIHDGDLVEVDTYAGVARILERADGG